MKTIKSPYEATIEVLKSKFTCIVYPLDNIDEFKNLLESIRKEHPKARHVVYAYRVGTASKSNDDGEPKGTAGRPLLELLHKKELNNIALFVVRYFGGSKLGASRLLRTYVSSATNLLNQIQIVEL